MLGDGGSDSFRCTRDNRNLTLERAHRGIPLSFIGHRATREAVSLVFWIGAPCSEIPASGAVSRLGSQMANAGLAARTGRSARSGERRRSVPSFERKLLGLHHSVAKFSHPARASRRMG